MPRESLDINDYLCPICQSLLIEPVCLPCQHELCLSCFTLSTNQTSSNCPLCRTRILTWARLAVRKNQLVNQKKWNFIQKAFPERVKKRLNGDDDDDQQPGGRSDKYKRLAEPGEIHEWYESELARVKSEWQKQRLLEIEASELYIKKLQEEEVEQKPDISSQIKKEEEHKSENEASMKYIKSLLKTETDGGCYLSCDIKNISPPITPDVKVTHSSSGSLPKSNNLNNPQSSLLVPYFAKMRKSVNAREMYYKSCTITSDDPFLSQTFDEGLSEDGNLSKCPSISKDVQTSLSPRVSSSCAFYEDQFSYLGCKTSSPSRSSAVASSDMDINSSRPTSSLTNVLNSSLSEQRSSVSSSSIDHEFTHFKPIVSSPLTPKKHPYLGEIVKPLSVKSDSKAIRIVLQDSSDSTYLDPNLNLGSPVMQRHLKDLQSEHQNHILRMSKSTLTEDNTRLSCSKKLFENIEEGANIGRYSSHGQTQNCYPSHRNSKSKGKVSKTSSKRPANENKIEDFMIKRQRTSSSNSSSTSREVSSKEMQNILRTKDNNIETTINTETDTKDEHVYQSRVKHSRSLNFCNSGDDTSKEKALNTGKCYSVPLSCERKTSRLKRSSSGVSIECNLSRSNSLSHTTSLNDEENDEERDRQFALNLQEKYNFMARYRLNESNGYSFRKRKCS